MTSGTRAPYLVTSPPAQGERNDIIIMNGSKEAPAAVAESLDLNQIERQKKQSIRRAQRRGKA